GRRHLLALEAPRLFDPLLGAGQVAFVALRREQFAVVVAVRGGDPLRGRQLRHQLREFIVHARDELVGGFLLQLCLGRRAVGARGGGGRPRAGGEDQPGGDGKGKAGTWLHGGSPMAPAGGAKPPQASGRVKPPQVAKAQAGSRPRASSQARASSASRSNQARVEPRRKL